MAEIELKCTKMVARDGGIDPQGHKITYHEKCGKPAAEVEIGGLLGKARAVLCAAHRALADKQAYISKNGYPKGKIDPKAKERGYAQERLPGTGIIK